MDDRLESICLQVAHTCIETAKESAHIVEELISRSKKEPLTKNEKKEIFEILCFKNWAFANGTWSIIENDKARKYLLEKSILYTVTAIGFEVVKSEDKELMELLPELDTKFKIRLLDYNKRIKELNNSGFDHTSNVVKLVVLEWIQTYFNLGDYTMTSFSREFVYNMPDYSNVDSIAKKAYEVIS